jgi:hypothetical protein
MKRPTFNHGIIVAAVLGFFASALVATLTPFLGLGAVLRLVIPALGLAYVLYLFSRSTELIHVAAIWLLRSLYFYSGVLPALMDLGISTLSVSAAVWAITRSGSMFLATWCFFLVQALFVAIPPRIKRVNKYRRDTAAESQPFETARRQADQALRQLFTQ